MYGALGGHMKIVEYASKVVRFCVVFTALFLGASAFAADPQAPTPLLTNGHPVDWWFVFKVNTSLFPECGGTRRQCIFGGDVQTYNGYGQQYVFASSENG